MAATATGKTLSRDYKHVRRQTPGIVAVNGWMGFGAGLALGLLVALGVFLHYQDREPAVPQPDLDVPPASARAADASPVPAADPGAAEAAPETAPPEGGTDYQFYELLPKQEVDVPPGPTPGAVGTRLADGELTLQAGSFKNPAEAERLQAKLAQYGVDAKIQRYPLEDETWYRVRIGPIATVEEREVMRAKLAEAEVEADEVGAVPTVPPPP
jgi:cell division protein FtsN